MCTEAGQLSPTNGQPIHIYLSNTFYVTGKDFAKV